MTAKAVTDEHLAAACAAADISLADLRLMSRQVDLVARRGYVIFHLDRQGYAAGSIGRAVNRDRCSVIWALTSPVGKAPPTRAEIEALVERMWKGNHTAKAISDRVTSVLGMKFSRDAVLGIVNRRGWQPSDAAAKTAARGDRQPAPATWSDAARAAVKARYLIAKNAREVAEALTGKLDGGRELSRIMVVGMAFRYKWPKPSKMAVPRGRTPRVRVPVAKPFAMAAIGSHRPASKPVKPVAPPIVLAPGDGVDLVDLPDDGCRHIIGQWGGAARYCGNPCPERDVRRAGQARYLTYCAHCTGVLAPRAAPAVLASQLRGA